MRLPRPHRLRPESVCSLTCQLGVGEATAYDLVHGKRKAIFVGEFTAYGFMAYSSMWLQSITGLTPLAAGLPLETAIDFSRTGIASPG